MEREFIEDKLRAIEEKAERERREVEYLCGVVDDHEDTLRIIAANPGQNEEEQSRSMYDMVSKQISGLEAARTAPFGAIVTYMPIISDSERRVTNNPAVQLGWAIYRPAFQPDEDYRAGDNFPHVLSLTEHGIHVIDGLRKIRGLPSLEEVR